MTGSRHKKQTLLRHNNKETKRGMLEQDWSKKTDSPKLSQYRREQNNLVLQKVSCTDEPGLGNQRGPSCSWSYPLHRERLLSGDATMRLVIWAWSTCLISCVTGSFGLAWLLREGAHWEVSPMFSFQGQTAKSAS